MPQQFLLSLFILLILSSNSWSAILVYNPSGTYTTKATLAFAATAADTAGKTVVVTSALSAVQSNISSATVHAWPSDRALRVEKGGSIGNTTNLTFADGATFTAGDYQVFTGSGTVTGLKEAGPEWFGQNTTPGVTDMSTAINKAALATKKLIFSPGESYGIGSTITFPNKELIIEANGATLQQIGTTQFQIISGTGAAADYTIDNIHIIGNGATFVADYPATSFYPLGKRLTFKNSTITNVNGTAIAANGFSDVLIDNNIITNAPISGIIVETTTGVVIKNAVITRNKISGITNKSAVAQSGIGITLFASNTGSGVENAIISKNIISNCESMGLSITPHVQGVVYSGKVVVSGNIIDTITRGGSSTWQGYGAGIELIGKNIVCSGNIIKETTRYGITITGVVDSVVSDNTIKSSVSSALFNGIYIGGSSLATVGSNSNVSVSNNRIYFDGDTTNQGLGIVFILHDAVNVRVADTKMSITDNSITGMFYMGLGMHYLSDDVVVRGNNINVSTSSQAGNRAAYISGARTTFENNVLRAASGKVPAEINWVPASGYISNLVLRGNTTLHATDSVAYNIYKAIDYCAMIGNVSVLDSGASVTIHFTSNNAANLSAITDSGNSWNYAAAVPSGTDYWVVGQKVINSAPAVGQPKGWLCTVTGTPGTWVSEGNL